MGKPIAVTLQNSSIKSARSWPPRVSTSCGVSPVYAVTRALVNLP
jgi:hypothetical protein